MSDSASPRLHRGLLTLSLVLLAVNIGLLAWACSLEFWRW